MNASASKENIIKSSEPIEKSVLGSILIKPELGIDLNIDANMFFTWSKVADHILSTLSEAGTVTVQEVSSSCEKKKICSGGDIIKLFANASPSEIGRHAAILRENWLNIKEQEICEESISRLAAGESVEDVCIRANANREMLQGTGDDKDQSRIDKTLSFLETTQNRKDGKIPKGFSTGFKCLDDYMGGLHTKRFIVLAARPGMGKTTLTLQMAVYLASCGIPTVYFCYEMPFELLLQKIVQQKTGISRIDMQTGNLTDIDMVKINKACEWFYDLPLYIEDYPYEYSVLMSKLRQYRRKYGVMFGFVDYLQRVENRLDNSGREDLKVGKMSTGLANLSLSEDMGIIALSQLSRKCEARNDKRPIESDLRESGAIEQDATNILMLYRDTKYYEQSEDTRTEVLRRKDRLTGNIGTSYLMYLKSHDMFKESNCQRWEYDGSDSDELDINPSDDNSIAPVNMNITPPSKKDDDDDIPF